MARRRRQLSNAAALLDRRAARRQSARDPREQYSVTRQGGARQVPISCTQLGWRSENIKSASCGGGWGGVGVGGTCEWIACV
jgi:hypothetical protein